ncbi:uncharacterized protein N7482_010020 [Penicillium canariense]|uniref:NmrA-like domain-containing protein n=1 Tax=Penicillium canariense TaxID=189055 RepID=A0A9W9HQN1_9EURO|nr:uncharacterized protein N7482_010020 [Penicillium canariense]KAJ5153542.1 hypothetical protein N7482_010020 [Penicillium canariense]
MRVAIAGGTSPTLGASIVSALLSTDGRYTPVVLSREGKIHSFPPGSLLHDVEIRYVNYHSQPSLVETLRDVEVVLSVLLIPGSDWVTAQVNLLHAAEEAGCRRFAPSEYALSSQAQAMVDLLDAKNTVWQAVQDSVDRGKIDAARFPCGMFMNYLGIGCPDEGARAEALSGFQEGPVLVHLEDPSSSWVEVPLRADGTVPSLTMTELRDVGKFIVAALDLQAPWAGRELGMAGDTLSFTTLIALCQRFTGRSVEARTVTEPQLQARLETIPSSQFIERMECQLTIVCCRDGSVVNPALNRLSSVRPTTVEQFMQRYWGSHNRK